MAGIKNVVKRAVDDALGRFNLSLVKRTTLRRLEESGQAQDDIALLHAFPPIYASDILSILKRSKSQFRQDIFALTQSGFKRGGYFVEFGATNGVDWSNSYLLEKEFGWSGILAEPAVSWHADLSRNRSAAIEKNCVWHSSGQSLEFREVEFSAELSSITSFNPDDKWHKERTIGKTYDVQTISLIDLLRKHEAPRDIDFLSIDTEGSELSILSAFDFNAYNIKAITCEHNLTPDREKLFELLTRNGYERIFPELSKCDDWFVRKC